MQLKYPKFKYSRFDGPNYPGFDMCSCYLLYFELILDKD
jgi:hypothetical protein